MVVRTVSQLPSIDKQSLNDCKTSSFVEVSQGIQKDGINTFVSKKAVIGDFCEIMEKELSSEIVEQHQMNDASGNRILIRKQLYEVLSSVVSGDMTVSGVKELKDFQWISSDMPTSYEKYGGSVDNIIPNIKKVKQLVTSSPSFVSTTSSYIADGNPFTDFNGNPLSDAQSIYYKYTVEPNDGKFYYWQIQNGNTDSSNTTWDGISQAKVGYQEIRDDGQLVVWGWLADGGVVAPENCWVGIFGRMKAEENNDSMIYAPLQINSWIRGPNATKLQYVGFNVPVRKGLQLKMKTGFAVNGEGSGYYQNPGTMTFSDQFRPNSFFGYVIKSQS